jgi:ABC-type multidrug transport system ATPase subunit
MRSISEFKWENVSLTIGDKTILSDVSGGVATGEVMALMGPSGSGKTTLLNVLAQRNVSSKYKTTGNVFTDEFKVNSSNIKEFSSYVEQEDSLIGSLTVKETVDFSCKMNDLNSNANTMKKTRNERVDEIIRIFGLSDQKDVQVGTPIQKGLSGGQKRRLSVASQMITYPSVLFLDEPTSGLDSASAAQVVAAIKGAARTFNIAVIISIHQPSTSTFNLLDKVMFLSKGKTIYNGAVRTVCEYFQKIDYPIPPHFNPSEYILDLINTDFSNSRDFEVRNAFESGEERIELLQQSWKNYNLEEERKILLSENDSSKHEPKSYNLKQHAIRNMHQTINLSLRAFRKSRRDILAYYFRIALYMGLALLMGTVWLRLNNSQDSIQPFINAIFYSGAFMSFMTVAYVPAYLEDYSAYKKEHFNGLYGASAFVVSNFIVGVPYIFITTILFSIVTYFMINFRESASGFWYYVMWLFLDLLAAESMTVFVASIFPIFVVALAIVAFLNGLWMSVNGFMVSPSVLNAFWKYTFYWVNYQRFVFQGMMFNEFIPQRIFNCGSGCHCMYSSVLESQCQIAGDAVLKAIGYGSENKSLWVGLLIAIIFFFRLSTYVVLKIQDYLR